MSGEFIGFSFGVSVVIALLLLVLGFKLLGIARELLIELKKLLEKE